jgi:hypothetical protein
MPRRPCRRSRGSRGSVVALRPDHVLHREAHVDQVAVARDVDVLEVVQQRRALYQGMFSERSTTLSPLSAEIGMNGEVGDLELGANSSELVDDLVEDLLVQSTRSILLTRDQVRDAQQRRDEGVPAGLLDHALAGVDEHDRQVGGRGAGHHVAGVLDVARGVGDDELALRRGEVAVGDVDRDALLALGAQAVGEQREVDVLVAALRWRRSTCSSWSSKIVLVS